MSVAVIDCVAVVGTGSAGRRHAATLRRSLPNAELVVVQRVGSNQSSAPFVDIGARLVPTVEDALTFRPRVAVVASPAPFHRPAAELFFAEGAHVLVEKPLADVSEEADAVVRAARTARRELVVGYHLRYGDTVPRLKQLVDEGAIDEPITFRLAVGQHLAQWRPGTDPLRSVSARRELGGGVLLELSHELDGLRYLLGEVHELSARLSYTGAPTDGLVETEAELALRMTTGVVGEIHLDMVSSVPFRRWELGGTSGRLVADLLTGRIERTDLSGTSTIVAAFPPGERDRAENQLVANLLAAAGGLARPACTGADGLAAVALVEAASASARSGQPQVVSTA